MPVGWVLQTCLLDHDHSISMPSDLLPLNIVCLMALCFSICYTCWYGVSLSAVSAGMVSHYQPCLLVWCFIIDHAFWFGTSLSAMPVGVVPHYRSCLLVWRLTVSHFFWCGASLQAMPVGVVTHYRPCLLVRFALQTTFWLVECRRKRGGYKSGATLTEVPLHQTCLLIMSGSCATLRNTCLYSATLSDMHAGFIYSDTRVCKVLLHQARNLVYYKSTRHAYRLGAAPTVCKTYQLPSWTPSWIYQILSDALTASLRCYKDDAWTSRIS